LRRGAFQFDRIAVGIVDIERRADAFRPVTLTGFDDRDIGPFQIGADGHFVERRNLDRKMIHIALFAFGTGAPHAAKRTGERHKIDQAFACAHLIKANLRLFLVHRAAQHIAIEMQAGLQIVNAQDDMIELAQLERCGTHSALIKQRCCL
jgi:hypothetical protein